MSPRATRSERQPVHSEPPHHVDQPVSGRWLEIEEVRLVSDLRIMHAKVEELYQLSAPLSAATTKTPFSNTLTSVGWLKTSPAPTKFTSGL